MSIYLVTGLALSGKKTLFNGVHTSVAHSAYYSVIGVETTKDSSQCSSPYEHSISSEEFHAKNKQQQFLHTWIDKSQPHIHYGISNSFLSTLRSGRKVMIFAPFQAIPALEKSLVATHPTTTIILAHSNDTLQARIKAALPLSTTGKETEAQKEDKKRRLKLLQESIESATSVGVGKLALGLIEKPEKTNAAAASSTTKPTTPRGSTPASSAAIPPSSSSSPLNLTPSLSASSTDPHYIGYGYQNDAGVDCHSTILCLPSAPTPAESLNLLLTVFGFDAALEAKRQNEFDLQTCAAQDYLARTVFPILYPALQQVDAVRPVDAIEYLAMLLQKESASQAKRVSQLNDIHAIREQLRTQFKQEYSVSGRV